MRALTVPICRGMGSVCENQSENAWSAIVSREVSQSKEASQKECMTGRRSCAEGKRSGRAARPGWKARRSSRNAEIETPAGPWHGARHWPSGTAR